MTAVLGTDLYEPAFDQRVLEATFPSTPVSLDREIESLRRLLRDRPQAAVSFDCFDTLLWRSVPKPTDAFVILGRRLRDVGCLRLGSSPGLFAKMRIMAERIARAQAMAARRTPEVKLSDIYALPGWSRHTGLTGAELARHELIVESMVTTADPWLKDLVEELAADGHERKIMVVSDTYLKSTEIRYLLDSAGFGCLANAPIFSSAEHGISKPQGLLRLAAAKLGVSPQDCVHVGNSESSDIESAKSLGMTAVHLPEYGRITSDALHTEGWLGADTEACELLHPRVGDSGLSALRGRMDRHRPVDMDSEDAVYWEVGAGLLGPVLTGFAEWVHERCGELGVDTALCVMREGELLAKMLDAVPTSKRACKAVPFWASREACLRASFVSGSAEELQQQLTWRVAPPTPEEVLASVGLRPQELGEGPDLLPRITALGAPSEVAQALIAFLAGRDDLRRLIVERSAIKRKSFARYLMSCLADEGGTVALVDLGFGGTIQEHLHNIARAEGLPIDFRGLYLYTVPRSIGRQLGGHLFEGFLGDAGSPAADITALDRSPEIIEELTTSSHGSLLEIKEDKGLLLAAREPLDKQDRQRAAVQAGTLAFQRDWNHFSSVNTLNSQHQLSQQRRTLHRILARFIAKPSLEIATAFADWTHDSNCGLSRTDPLVPELIRRSSGYLPPEYLHLSVAKDLYWAGAAAREMGLTEELHALQQGLVPTGHFVHTDVPGKLVLSVVDSQGQERVASKVPILWSKNGQAVIACSQQSLARSFYLRTSGPEAVIRLDRLLASFDDGAVTEFDWRGPRRSTPTGIRFSADVHLREGIALLSESSAAGLRVDSNPSARLVGLQIQYAALLA